MERGSTLAVACVHVTAQLCAQKGDSSFDEAHAFFMSSVMRLRDVYPGSEGIFQPGSEFLVFSIPDPNFFPTRLRIKELKYYNPKKWFLSSMKYDPSCSSRIPDPGVRGTGSRIRKTLGNISPPRKEYILLFS